MVTDADYLTLARGLMLLITDLQVDIGVLKLAVQKNGISAEVLEECKREVLRRFPIDDLRAEIRDADLSSLLAKLRGYSDTVQ